jgi:hypothetical protein
MTVGEKENAENGLTCGSIRERAFLVLVSDLRVSGSVDVIRLRFTLGLMVSDVFCEVITREKRIKPVCSATYSVATWAIGVRRSRKNSPRLRLSRPLI